MTLILDIGCGNLPQHVSRSNIGIDIVKRPAHKPEIFFCADACHLPFKEDLFEAVIFNQVIEHLDNPKACLKEILRTLKPEGRLYLATPNIYHWRRLLMIMRGKNPHDDTIDHIGCWTSWELGNLLREVGFAEINVQTSTFGYSRHRVLDQLAQKILSKKISDLHLYACARKK